MVTLVIAVELTMRNLYTELIALQCCDYKMEEILDCILRSHQLGHIYIDAMRIMMPYTFEKYSQEYDVANLHVKLNEIAPLLWSQLDLHRTELLKTNQGSNSVLFSYKSIAGTMLVINAHFGRETFDNNNVHGGS